METAALDVLAMEVGSAIEEALLPLRMQACDLNVRDPVAVLKDVDAALELNKATVAVLSSAI